MADTTNTTTFLTSVSVCITDAEAGAPRHKLANAELHFEGGDLDGTKLVGFAIWRGQNGSPNVTLPSRNFGQGDTRKSFSLLRSNCEGSPDIVIRQTILRAFASFTTGRALDHALARS